MSCNPRLSHRRADGRTQCPRGRRMSRCRTRDPGAARGPPWSKRQALSVVPHLIEWGTISNRRAARAPTTAWTSHLQETSSGSGCRRHHRCAPQPAHPHAGARLAGVRLALRNACCESPVCLPGRQLCNRNVTRTRCYRQSARAVGRLRPSRVEAARVQRPRLLPGGAESCR